MMKAFKFARLVFAVVLILIFLWVGTWMLYPLRNSKGDVVSERFIKNNETIRSEAGEIKEISRSNKSLTSKSEELARRLKNGENLSEIKPDIPQPNKIIGTKKTIEYRVSVEQCEYFNRGIYYFVVKEAAYRDEGGDWQNIPIGWFENYFLLFK